MQSTEDWYCDTTATVTNEKKVWSKEKVKFVSEIENGKMKTDLCGEFGFVNSMIKKMWESRTKITYAFKKNRSRIKLFQNPEKNDTDEALCKLFKQQTSDNLPVNSPFLMINLVLSKL